MRGDSSFTREGRRPDLPRSRCDEKAVTKDKLLFIARRAADWLWFGSYELSAKWTLCDVSRKVYEEGVSPSYDVDLL